MTELIKNRASEGAIKDSRAALRGVNSHITTVLQHSDMMSKLAAEKAQELRDTADRLGDILVMEYSRHESKSVPVPLKRVIHRIANELMEGAAK